MARVLRSELSALAMTLYSTMAFTTDHRLTLIDHNDLAGLIDCPPNVLTGLLRELEAIGAVDVWCRSTGEEDDGVRYSISVGRREGAT